METHTANTHTHTTSSPTIGGLNFDKLHYFYYYYCCWQISVYSSSVSRVIGGSTVSVCLSRDPSHTTEEGDSNIYIYIIYYFLYNQSSMCAKKKNFIEESRSLFWFPNLNLSLFQNNTHSLTAAVVPESSSDSHFKLFPKQFVLVPEPVSFLLLLEQHYCMYYVTMLFTNHQLVSLTSGSFPNRVSFGSRIIISVSSSTYNSM